MRQLLFLVLTLIATATHAGGEAMPVTDVHRAIASQHVWLNTSRPLTAEDLRGRIVLLDFWTLGCINCMDIIPDLKALEHEFGDKLTVIGVHSAKFANEKDTENIRSAVMRYGLTHPVVNDADFAIWTKFDVRAWPTQVLINPEGAVSIAYSGEGHRAELEADIKTLIASYQGKIVTAPLPIALESGKLAQTALSFPGKVIAGYWGEGKSIPVLFVADSGHNRIVVMNPDRAGAIVQTIGDGKEGFKDGSFTQAEFYKPQGLAFKDGMLYVADLGNHALRLIDTFKGTVVTLAGTGEQGKALDSVGERDGLKTALASPWDVAFYPDEKHLAIAMAGAQQIWTYDINRRTVSLLAGNGHEAIDDGQYPFNSLSQPSGLFASGDKLYFTDAESSALRVLDKGGNITTLIGKGLFDFGYKEGDKADALLQHCSGLTGDASDLYIADTYNHSIRRYDIKEGKLHNYAGHDARGADNGAIATASFNEPGGLVLVGNTLYVADTNNHIIRAIDMKAGAVVRLDESQSSVPAPALTSSIPVVASLPTSLPNLQKLSFAAAHDVPVEVTLDLKPGWHINDSAPSQLALYIQADTNMRLTQFDRDALSKGHITLPKLIQGYDHRLMGTLYFCENKSGSLCMIKSFDVTLKPEGQDTKVALPVD